MNEAGRWFAVGCTQMPGWYAANRAASSSGDIVAAGPDGLIRFGQRVESICPWGPTQVLLGNRIAGETCSRDRRQKIEV